MRALSNTSEMYCSANGTCDYYYDTSFEHKCRYFKESLGDLMQCCATRCGSCVEYHINLDPEYFKTPK